MSEGSEAESELAREGHWDARTGMGVAMSMADLVGALAGLRAVRENGDRADPYLRDVSIAITHLEDALLRLRHGTPR